MKRGAKRDKALSYRNLSNDDILELLCWRLEIIGKNTAANKLRTTYYGLGADTKHREEPGQVSGTESDLGGTSDGCGSQSVLFPDSYSDACTSGEVSRPKDEYFRDIHGDTNN